jgi:hypothetical protein
MNGLDRAYCLAAACCCVLSVACDPEGPGASGVIELSPEIAAEDFATLEIRAYPDEQAAFDVARMPALAPASAGFPTSEVTFPYRYEIGEGPNTSPTKSWRMTAWLSTDLAGAERPGPNDPFCSVTFELASCGSFDDYCEVSDDVSCMIARP